MGGDGIARSRDIQVEPVSKFLSRRHSTDDHEQREFCSGPSMLSSRPTSLLRENGDFSHFTMSKTPGRALKGRAGLQENILHKGSMTANPREKKVDLQTPIYQGHSSMLGLFLCVVRG